MEGQVIKILQREVNGVDDGWWEGEVVGEGTVGLFPSLVVEECRSDGEPLTPDGVSGASPLTTPPPHTPPEVPGFLLPPERVIITQPTPVVECVDDLPHDDEPVSYKPSLRPILLLLLSLYHCSPLYHYPIYPRYQYPIYYLYKYHTRFKVLAKTIPTN
ncbi:hypothetical protein Pmani_037244 [Petrolisthes manimaculis]|uniref:SH3 domain-containing protein n=1 Tax=Petrolisthes manimaculis TaxID=1843537 RepID=A0AAE1NIU9_9EUCA|nr:hypothetical protein Pmani_037244 [Petrolisthes manimaculis]